MARSFNGTSDAISAPSAVIDMSGGQAFSFSCWVKATIAQANALNVIGESRPGFNGPFIVLQGNASGHSLIGARSATTGSSDALTGANVVFDNTWHHVVVTQAASSSVLHLYTDGTLDSNLSRTSLSNASGQAFTSLAFGALSRATVSGFYGGKLAGVALWTRTLSAKEAASLGAGLPASHLGPTHYWPLWGVDSPEPDIGNG